jgi:CO dehydrogenase/acetyl-CoA synthase beta subunit
MVILASKSDAAGVQRRLVQSTEIKRRDNAEVLRGGDEDFLPVLGYRCLVCQSFAL